MFKMVKFFKIGLKNVVLVTTGMIVGTGIIYAVNASPTDYTYYLDEDGDGYGTEVSTTTQSIVVPDGYAVETGDCDDTASTTNPGAFEICDGIDNDCDTQIDEDVLITYYYDIDGDSYGYSASSTEACSAPVNYVIDGGDCNEGDIEINPGADEICDSVDNNCDGAIDEEVLITYYYDADADLYGVDATTTEACSVPLGYAAVTGDCDDSDSAINPEALEVYDGIDNNCDGQIDEDIVQETYYMDADDDGYGDSSISTTSYTAVLGYVLDDSDCDDDNNTVYPGATEICDSLDNDCDTLVDEGLSFQTYYLDADLDGYGDLNSTTTECALPSGYADSNNDCDDSDSQVYPGAVEIDDDKDNDCDGVVDEGFDNNDISSEPVEPGDAGQYRNHGSFVSKWAHYFNFLKKEGTITGREKGQMMKEKAQEKKQNKGQKQKKNKK